MCTHQKSKLSLVKCLAPINISCISVSPDYLQLQVNEQFFSFTLELLETMVVISKTVAKNHNQNPTQKHSQHSWVLSASSW